MYDAPRDARKGGALGLGGGRPRALSKDGKRLIESVCRQDKDTGRAGAGSLECLPDNAQNLAKDEQLPGRVGREEPGTWPPPLSLPPHHAPQSPTEGNEEVGQEEKLVTSADRAAFPFLAPRHCESTDLPILCSPTRAHHWAISQEGRSTFRGSRC